MGIPWRDAGTWLGKAFHAHGVDQEGIQAGPENADSSDEVAKGSGAFLSWRYRGKRPQAAKAMIVAVVLVVLSGARYIMSRRSSSRLKTPKLPLDVLQLPVDDASMQKYIDDFTQAADEMERAWESSGPSTRLAFQKHYTPSLEDGQELPGGPLATIRDHVAKMRECKPPPNSSMEARRGFAQHLLVLHSICRTAKVRLEELKSFVSIHRKFDVPIPVPGHEEPLSYLALKDLEAKTEDGLTANNFLNALGLFGGGTAQRVERSLATNLIFLLDIRKRSNAANFMAQYYFTPVLQPFGEAYAFHAAPSTAEHPIPYSGKPFRTGALAQAAADIFRESYSTMHHANVRKLRRIADNWTNKEALRAAKTQEKENTEYFRNRLDTRRGQMRALMKEGIPKDDLVMSALFLL